MNANRARPLLAFWLLALTAAVIAALGLRAGAGAEVRTDTPTRQLEPSAEPAPVVGTVLMPGAGRAAPREHPTVPEATAVPARATNRAASPAGARTTAPRFATDRTPTRSGTDADARAPAPNRVGHGKARGHADGHAHQGRGWSKRL